MPARRTAYTCIEPDNDPGYRAKTLQTCHLLHLQAAEVVFPLRGHHDARPFDAKASAVALPIPLLAPVISETRPFMSDTDLLSFVRPNVSRSAASGQYAAHSLYLDLRPLVGCGGVLGGSIKFLLWQDPRNPVGVELQLHNRLAHERLEPRRRRQAQMARESVAEAHRREVASDFESADKVVPPSVAVPTG